MVYVLHFNEALLGLYLRGTGEFVLILDHPVAAISGPYGALNSRVGPGITKHFVGT